MTKTDMTVAKTILAQLGGQKFLVMTGAKHLTGSPNCLSFHLPNAKQANGVKYVKIRLNAMDTYDVEFLGPAKGAKKYDAPEVKDYKEGVYCDQLQAVFTAATGLATSLGTLGRAR
jgi:hypothetical protein